MKNLITLTLFFIAIFAVGQEEISTSTSYEQVDSIWYRIDTVIQEAEGFPEPNITISKTALGTKEQLISSLKTSFENSFQIQDRVASMTLDYRRLISSFRNEFNSLDTITGRNFNEFMVEWYGDNFLGEYRVIAPDTIFYARIVPHPNVELVDRLLLRKLDGKGGKILLGAENLWAVIPKTPRKMTIVNWLGSNYDLIDGGDSKTYGERVFLPTDWDGPTQRNIVLIKQK